MDSHEKNLYIAEEPGDQASRGDTVPKAIEKLHLVREADDRAREGTAYLNLGVVYKSRNDLSKAIECFEKASNKAREAGDRTIERNAYFQLGIAYNSRSCLLYTSPSPRDGLLSRMPSSA